MNLKDIQLLFPDMLVKFELEDSVMATLDDEIIGIITSIGLPKVVLDKYKAHLPLLEKNGTVEFAKSNVSEISLGIDVNTKEVICYSSTYNSRSFVNSNFESFMHCNFIYELYRQIV